MRAVLPYELCTTLLSAKMKIYLSRADNKAAAQLSFCLILCGSGTLDLYPV